MNDADFAFQEKRINHCFNFWVKRLRMLRRGWVFDLYFDRVGGDFREGKGKNDGWRVIARSRPQWEYMRGTITFNMPEIVTVTDDELDQVMVHELLHFVVAEMSEPDDDGKHEERVVTALTLIIVRTGKRVRSSVKPVKPAMESETRALT